MINGKNLLVANAAAKPEDDIWALLETICVEKKRTIGTNGKILVQISRLDIEEDSQDRTFYIPAESAKKIKLGKGQNLVFKQDEKSTTITLPDGTSHELADTKDKYPDVDAAYPEYKQPVKITVDAKLLKTICDIIIKFSKDALVTFTIEGSEPLPLSAVRFDAKSGGQTLSGLIMTVRTI
jgi:hypothetical protein